MAGISSAYSGDSVNIDRSGRRIQLDGFLMDWNEKNKHPWGGSAVWTWDAVKTTEGIAGYFHAKSAPCSSWTFYIDPRHASSRPIALRSGAGSSMYRTAGSLHDGSFAVTFEWIIPWDSLSIDGAGTFAVNCAGVSGRGDTLRPLLMTGSVSRKPDWLPSRFTERVVLIGVLLVLFLVLQRKVRKKSHRRESPRRST